MAKQNALSMVVQREHIDGAAT